MPESPLVLEVNEKFKQDNCDFVTPNGGIISVTTNISEDYWVFRVKLYKDQAILTFPKFFQMGVGFAQEKKWNKNSPSSFTAERIYKHIKANKKYRAITEAQCIEAINLIKEACKKNSL